MRILLVFIMLSMFGVQAIYASDTAHLYLDDVDQFQSNGWSCGIHSAYRILKGGYGQNADYNEMINTISYYHVPLEIVLLTGIIELYLTYTDNLAIGQPTPELVKLLKKHYCTSATSNNVSTERIKDLLWKGNPVMTLIQVGSKGGGNIYVCNGAIVSKWFYNNLCFGMKTSINTNYPVLHWLVAVGYDDGNIYCKDTSNNVEYAYDWATFEKYRNWKIAKYNGDIANLIKASGTKPGDVIYFNESIPHNKIARTGNRFPPTPEQIAAFLGVIRPLVIDDDGCLVTIIATDAVASESGSNMGQFAVTRSGNASAPLIVKYSVTGSANPGFDYQALPGTITIPAGQQSALIEVVPFDDAGAELNETVVVSILPDASYTVGSLSSATVQITDNDKPLVSVKAPDAQASEPGTDKGGFMFKRTGDISVSLTVRYAVSGTAKAGIDYKSLSGTVTIPAGKNSVKVQVVPLDDGTVESAETVIVTVAADPAYKIGSPKSAKVTIKDNDE